MTERRIAGVIAGIIVLAGVGVLLTLLWAGDPKTTRNWIPEQAVSARVLVNGDKIVIDSMRDFDYKALDKSVPGYAKRELDLRLLNKAWFVLTPFSKSWRGPAHVMVTFGFADSQYVSISVEARREKGETYGAWKGLWRNFELVYVIGTERDLLGQRAVYAGYPVYLYPVNTSPEKIRAMFVSMLGRSEGLRKDPEYYNTFSNNCTSNVIDHVNKITPGKIPGGWRTIMPGYTDEVAHQLGLIPNDGDISVIRDRYVINEKAKAAFGREDFSRRIRESK